MQLAQRFDHAQDLVVGFALGQGQGQAQVQRLGLEEQLTQCIGIAGGVQGRALAQIYPLCRSQRIE